MIKTKAVTVTTTPAKINEPEVIDSVPGQNVALYNSGGATVWVGGADVTTSNGFPLAPGGSISFEMRVLQDIFVVSAGSVEIRVLIEGYQ